MNPRLFFKDNVLVALCAYLLFIVFPFMDYVSLAISIMMLPILAYASIQIRFWRSPKRKVSSSPMDIASPADGRVIYIKKVEEGNIPVAIKKGDKSELAELNDLALLPIPCWQIGINMTPFDVHKNCSPIEGTIIFSKHYDGKFLSLKNQRAVSENERHTYVIENDRMRVAMVQIASKRVRRIDSYVKQGDHVDKGAWLGMIRFGSQVDVFLPLDSELCVKIGQQVFAGSVVLAKTIK